MKIISNIIPIPNREIELRCGNHCSEAKEEMVAQLKLSVPVITQEENRFNGCIVDYETNKKVVDCVIMPSLVPICGDDGMYSEIDEPNARVRFVEISTEDVIKSEQSRQILYASSASGYINISSNIECIDFRREYKMEFFEKYSRPIIEKELNGDKVFFYTASGIPKENIKYETEFINKTKQTYLNIKGQIEYCDLDFNSEINVHMLIDTDVYDGFEVKIHDGIVEVALHEIKNETPVLKDMSI